MSTYPNDPTPMSEDPEVLRQQIEQTRSNLSRDVDALGEAASPGNIARRQAEKVGDTVRGAGHSIKEKIMGSDDTYGSYGTYGSEPGLAGRASEATSDLGHRVGDLAGSARDTVTSAPDIAKRRTRGNPLAAGVVALGAGWLLGSLLPGSEKERELAVSAKEKVRDSGVVEEVKSIAQEVVDDVKPQAKESFEQVRTTATEGAQQVKEDASSAAEDVRASAEQSKDRIQDESGQGPQI